MSEPKYRCRIPPCPAYDIPGMESWLEDMAAKGLHLAPDGFFGALVTFEEGPPQKEKFRLEPTATKKGLLSDEYGPDDDAVQLHRQMGWVYRARRDQFHIYASTDPNAPELHTDPQVQAITMAALTKYLWKSLRGTLLLAALYALLYFGDTIITGAIYLGTWRVALLAGLLMWNLGRRVRALVVLSRCRRQLQRGEPLPHRSSNRRRNLRYLAFGAARGVLWVVLAVSLIAYLPPLMTGEPYVSLADQTFPFPTLEDLHRGADVERMNGILKSQAYSWSDPLAPESYDFSEYAEIRQNGTAFDCYLTVTYHRTRWEWTARLLTAELVSQAGGNPTEQLLNRLFGREPVVITKLDLPDADYCAWFCKDLPAPYLVIRQGSIVLRVRYAPLSHGIALEPEELARSILSQIR